MKKILLTGGNGFFCTRFTEHFANKYDILSLGKDELDIVDEEKVMATLKNFKPDYVIHAAAIAITDFCNNHPEIAYRINVEGTVNVARACKETQAKLIFLSTEQVFNGNLESGPYDENNIPVPDTVYGQNKLEAEGLLRSILDELWILRFTWLFGLPKNGSKKISANIAWSTVEAILKEEKIVAPVHEYRGMTYIQELLENFEKVFHIPYGTYHIGSKNDMNRYDVVRLIINEMGLKHKMEEILLCDTEKYNENPRDVRLNTDKLSKEGIIFGTTEEGIKRCFKEEFNINKII